MVQPESTEAFKLVLETALLAAPATTPATSAAGKVTVRLIFFR